MRDWDSQNSPAASLLLFAAPDAAAVTPNTHHCFGKGYHPLALLLAMPATQLRGDTLLTVPNPLLSCLQCPMCREPIEAVLKIQ